MPTYQPAGASTLAAATMVAAAAFAALPALPLSATARAVVVAQPGAPAAPSPTLQILTLTDLPHELRAAVDLRWGGPRSVYLALGSAAVVKVPVGPGTGATDPANRCGGRRWTLA
jgi:hypothetical protein